MIFRNKFILLTILTFLPNISAAAELKPYLGISTGLLNSSSKVSAQFERDPLIFNPSVLNDTQKSRKNRSFIGGNLGILLDTNYLLFGTEGFFDFGQTTHSRKMNLDNANISVTVKQKNRFGFIVFAGYKFLNCLKVGIHNAFNWSSANVDFSQPDTMVQNPSKKLTLFSMGPGAFVWIDLFDRLALRVSYTSRFYQNKSTGRLTFVNPNPINNTFIKGTLHHREHVVKASLLFKLCNFGVY